jgi:predicted phosphodiesterase
MLIYACSDLHVSPEHFSSRAREFLEEAISNQANWTLLCGDIYEGTAEYKVQESIDSPNGQELCKLIKQLPKALIIEGNHDYDLRKHLPESSNYKVKASHSLEIDGGKVLYVTHGSQEYDSRIRRIRHIYWFFYWLFPRASKIRRLLRRLLKTPSEMKAEGRTEPEVDLQYWTAVRKMSTLSILQAIQERCVPIWGHTHRRHLDAYEDWLSINCGDFDRDEFGDNTGGIIIEDGMAREWRSDRPPVPLP